MATDTWDNDDGDWATWAVHWAAANWTNTTPVPAIVARDTLFNLKNNTFAEVIPAMTTLSAKINERWRVEPAQFKIGSTPDAKINWRNITNPAALVLSTVNDAQINWRNYTNTVHVISELVPRAAKINLRWRVEPSALVQGLSTRDAEPGDYVFSPSGLKLTTFPFGPITTYDAFTKVGPWPDTDPKQYIDVLAESRTIRIPAEDRSIQIDAEDRTITIPMAEDLVVQAEDRTIIIKV